MTNTAATLDFRISRNGFPLEVCRRCGGNRRLPQHSPVLNGVCFSCKGTGYGYPAGKPTKLAHEWRDIFENAATVCLTTHVTVNPDGSRTVETPVRVGDIVRPHKSEPWRTVAAVRVTRRVVGWALGADDEFRRFRLETLVTFTDGTTEQGWGVQWQRQVPGDLLAVRDRLAAQACDAYRRTLARRAARR